MRPVTGSSSRPKALAMTVLAAVTFALGGCVDVTGIGGSDCNIDWVFPGLDECGGGANFTTRAIEVTTITTGEGIDADGYSVEIRQGMGSSALVWRRHVSANESETYVLARGDDGDHSVELADVASNCDVSGDNPRVVVISSPDTTKIAFEIHCPASG